MVISLQKCIKYTLLCFHFWLRRCKVRLLTYLWYIWNGLRNRAIIFLVGNFVLLGFSLTWSTMWGTERKSGSDSKFIEINQNFSRQGQMLTFFTNSGCFPFDIESPGVKPQKQDFCPWSVSVLMVCDQGNTDILAFHIFQLNDGERKKKMK